MADLLGVALGLTQQRDEVVHDADRANRLVRAQNDLEIGVDGDDQAARSGHRPGVQKRARLEPRVVRLVLVVQSQDAVDRPWSSRTPESTLIVLPS